VLICGWMRSEVRVRLRVPFCQCVTQVTERKAELIFKLMHLPYHSRCMLKTIPFELRIPCCCSSSIRLIMCCGGSRTERESKGRSCRTQLKTRCKETCLNNQNTFDSLQSLPLTSVHEFRAFFLNSCVASAVRWKIFVM
jgi:hypothetical protein